MNMGDNFNGLELLATRFETVFRSGCVAVTRPMGEGVYVSESRMDPPSTFGGRVRITHSIISGGLAIEADGREIARVHPPSGVPALDWLNTQSCSLLSDSSVVGEADVWQGLAWKNGLFRHSNLADRIPRDLKQLSADIRLVTVDFPDASVITSAAGPEGIGRSHVSWESRVTVPGTNEIVGRVRLWTETQAVAFSFPGMGDDASISPKNLGRPFPFDPTPAWGTVQALSFYKSLKRHSQVREGAQQASLRPASMSIVPVRRGDGCTGLWFLNGTLFERCCEDHDRCYVRYSCDASSWFRWMDQFWMCTACNMAVAICFEDTACLYLGGIACP